MQAETIGRVHLRRIRPERRERRFYRIDIVTDLFGTVLLRRSWGRIGTDGRLRSEPYADVAAARLALTRLAARKCRRGYTENPDCPRFQID